MKELQGYERDILNHLLEQYERSSFFRTGVYSRRILYRASSDGALTKRLEDPDEKTNFLYAVAKLKEKGILDYSWMKYEEGNIVESIWLSLEEESVRTAYQIAGRRPLQQLLNELAAMLSESIDYLQKEGTVQTASSPEDAPRQYCLQNDVHGVLCGDSLQNHVPDTGSLQKAVSQTEMLRMQRKGILNFLETTLRDLERKKRLPSFFTEDLELDRNLVHFLVMLPDNQDPQMERVVSARLYGDSKYFEHELRPRVISILRQIRKNNPADETRENTAGERAGKIRNIAAAVAEDEIRLSDEEILLEYGISRWPEVYELCGNLSVELDSGAVISYGNERYGAYLNAETVRHICRVITEGISNILFIENKANYVWAVQKINAAEESSSGSLTDRAFAGISHGLLLVFHGGFYSPMKGRLFREIIAACPPDTSVWHWSDIDVGGFRIFMRLKEKIAAGAEPFLMDLDTLKVYESCAMPISSESYLLALTDMYADDRYRSFHPLIDYMILKRIRLEQENEIPDSH